MSIISLSTTTIDMYYIFFKQKSKYAYSLEYEYHHRKKNTLTTIYITKFDKLLLSSEIVSLGQHFDINVWDVRSRN